MAVRRSIQGWNRQVFGNIFYAVKMAEVELLRAEKGVETDASEEAQTELQRVQAELRRALAMEEQFWHQKAKIKWLHHGTSTPSTFMLWSSRVMYKE